jgi:predicted transcriptional regulator of viral defense system
MSNSTKRLRRPTPSVSANSLRMTAILSTIVNTLIWSQFLQKPYIYCKIFVVMDAKRKRALFELADQQAGYFTAAQARAMGYSDRLIHHHKHQGNWLEAGWGLYRLRDYPTSEEEELVRLSLWSRDKMGRPQAVVSHDTALALHELSDLMPDRYHLSVPPGFRKVSPAGVVLHRVRLAPDEAAWRGSYRITTPLRTLLDVAQSGVSPEHVTQAAWEALERGMVRRKALVEAIQALSAAERLGFEAALESRQ